MSAPPPGPVFTPLTPAAVAALPDKRLVLAAFDNIWYRVGDDLAALPRVLAALPPGYRLVYHLVVLDAEINNGGFNQYFYRCNGLSIGQGGAAGCESDRVSQTVNGVTTYYVLDSAGGLTQVLAEVTGGVTTTYLYGNGRIAQYDGSDFEYFLGDALGSVRQLADENGDVTLARSYEPYGDVLSSAGSGVTSYSFTGEWRDGNGLIYLRARYYASGVGRFVTRDTWRGMYNNPLSLNRWTYAENSPIDLADPTGMFACHEILDWPNRRCEQWVIDALATIESHGPVGQIVASRFRLRDELLTAVQDILKCSDILMRLHGPDGDLLADFNGPGLNIEFAPIGSNFVPSGGRGAQLIVLDSSNLDVNPSASAWNLGVFAHEVVHSAIETNENRATIAGEVYAYQVQARVFVENGGQVIAGDLLFEMSQIDLHSKSSLLAAQEFLVTYWWGHGGKSSAVVYALEKLAPDGWTLYP
ncbi:MAG: hypothetical protein IT317_02375 [Anaerolineales bacterium]|nr:hypothetical protein [Anaerolineales bacterium]